MPSGRRTPSMVLVAVKGLESTRRSLFAFFLPVCVWFVEPRARYARWSGVSVLMRSQCCNARDVLRMPWKATRKSRTQKSAPPRPPPPPLNHPLNNSDQDKDWSSSQGFKKKQIGRVLCLPSRKCISRSRFTMRENKDEVISNVSETPASIPGNP